jgi:hypothetical protein
VTLLARFAVRTLALSGIYVVALVAFETSGSTDGLGAGLLVFLVFVLVAIVWGVVDGRRGSAGTAIAAWFLTGAALGVVTSVVIAIQESDAGALGSDLAGGVPFFAIMIGIPAAVGVGIGALVRRSAG